METLEAWLLGYPALAIACVFSGLGLPLPEDLVVLYAGISVATGNFELAPAAAIVFVGFLTRDTMAWSLGHWLGDRLLRAAWFNRFVPRERIEMVQGMIQRQGPRAVLGARMMVGVRATAFAVAGASGIPFRQFLMWDLLGLAITAPLLLGAGYLVGPPVIAAAQGLLPVLQSIVFVVLFVAASYVAWRWWHQQEPAE